MKISASLCIFCKGSKGLCGHSPCPLLAKQALAPKFMETVDKEFFGPSPSIFVGRYGYPKVFVGPLASIKPETAAIADNPAQWMGESYSKIVEYRTSLLRTKSRSSVFSKDAFIRDTQELALAKKPTDVEMWFTKKPVYRLTFSEITQPMGPTANLDVMRVTENVKIARTVQKVMSDEMRAAQSANLLYTKGQDVYKITTILSSGALGLEQSQKLVPTRWSITATDDILAKQIMQDIRQYPSINEYQVYSHSFLDNHFEILLMPGNWEYEGFEAWAPGSTWYQGASSDLRDAGLEFVPSAKPVVVQEYEPFKGRTRYADKQAGGYYAARFGVVEALHEMRRQARAVVFREIYEGYTVPVGVWQVRENVRAAMQNPSEKFATLNEALGRISSRLRIPLQKYKEQSIMLRQQRLSDYF